MIDLGYVTTSLVTKLAILLEPFDIIVGDGVAPPGGGWPEGVPNTQAVFSPYVVLRYGAPTTAMQNDVPLCSSIAVRFLVNYTLTAYDNTRPDADRIAELARDALNSIGISGDESYGDLTARFHLIFVDTMTGATRDDSTFPQMWASATNFRLDVARKP